MIVAGLQYDIAWEDPHRNFRMVEGRLKEAAERGTRLAVLPEMFATGFSMEAEVMAQHAPSTREFLADRAKHHQMWIAAGFAVPGSPRPRNVCTLFTPEGEEALSYHKIHPFTLGGESDHYHFGEEVQTGVVEGTRVTPFICYDLRFPEIFRTAATGTDLFLVIASWPKTRRLHWRHLLIARAIENQAYVLGLNRVGEGGGLEYAGDSLLLDPWGEIMDDGGSEDRWIHGEVNAARVVECRHKLPFQQDRRPELYARLERELE